LEEGAEAEGAVSRITTVVQGVEDRFKPYNCSAVELHPTGHNGDKH